MNRTRTALAVASVLAAGFSLTPIHAMAENECQQRILNIVAHHDDDLLFLSPDLINDIQQGKCVQTVFLVASDYPNGRSMSDEQYLKERELGVREAYAEAAGEDPANWTSSTYFADTKLATQWTLNEKISVVELRISDAATAPGDSLWWLYAENQTVTTRAGDQNPAQTFTRTELGDFLRRVVATFLPNEIHAGDPLADHHWENFHKDHIAAARLVRWALDGRQGGPPVKAYRDYSISASAPNLTSPQIEAKTDLFQAFVRHDYDICRTGAGTPCEPSEWFGQHYRDWMSRQYLVDQNWRQGWIEPLPQPYVDNHRTDPHIGGKFKIRNVATGQELAINNAWTHNGAELITWHQGSSANMKFQMSATPRGWEIVPQNSGRCLEVPNSSQGNGQHVAQWDCTGNANQALRTIKQPDGSYELVFAHSNMRLTAPTSAGNYVRQAYYDANAHSYQKWQFIPTT